MNKRTIWIIVSLMSLALVGLISFQIYWINSAISLTRERFEKDVQESLRNVAIRLEKGELYQVATASGVFEDIRREWIQEQPSPDSDVEHTPGETQSEVEVRRKIVYRSDGDGASVLFEFSDSSASLSTSISATSEVSDANPPPAHENTVGGVPPPNHPHADGVVIDVQRLEDKSTKLHVMVREMLEFEANSQRRVEPHVLDSMLHEEFGDKGIDITFDFGVYNLDEQRFILSDTEDRETLARSPLRANLFPNDVLGNVTYLMVNFPGQESFLVQQVWATLATSLILIGIIIFCFVYAINVIIRQKKLSEMKTDFINNMTHELKTPISTVSLATEALREDAIAGDKDAFNRYLGIIREETARLGGHVEKVLQAAKLEKEELKLRMEPIKLSALLEKSLEPFQLSIERLEGSLRVEMDLKNESIFGDEMHLANVIQNLLDNAVKYAGEESPSVTVSVSEPTAESIRIDVCDNGVGMRPEETRRIFERFYRVPTGNRHDSKGFGLGLSYVKTIIDNHGGSITVESTPNQGSCFSIHLPRENG